MKSESLLVGSCGKGTSPSLKSDEDCGSVDEDCGNDDDDCGSMEGELESSEELRGVLDELDAGGISEDEECALSDEAADA